MFLVSIVHANTIVRKGVFTRMSSQAKFTGTTIYCCQPSNIHTCRRKLERTKRACCLWSRCSTHQCGGVRAPSAASGLRLVRGVYPTGDRWSCRVTNSVCMSPGRSWLWCRHPAARNTLGWPKRRKLAHAFLRDPCSNRLQLAQLRGQLSVFLTRPAHPATGVHAQLSHDYGVDVERLQLGQVMTPSQHAV
jgi:hypothetical protein